jgi:hypothetical protein
LKLKFIFKMVGARFHLSDRGDMPDNVRETFAGDPSLRLKSGWAQDDIAGMVGFL